MESSTTLELEGSHRYGIVLAGALATVLFLIIAPESSWSRAIGRLLAGGMLLGVFAITTMAKIDGGMYFAQGTDGSESQRVYFSFTSMTTTGFGDLTPAQRGGRAVAVLEMLTGQIYLVTVISLLVGNLRRRREADA